MIIGLYIFLLILVFFFKLQNTIYDTPTERDAKTKTDFQKLRETFENNSKSSAETLSNSNQPSRIDASNQPVVQMAKSIENIYEEGMFKKKGAERKYATEVKRYKPKDQAAFGLPKKNPQLDVDRENVSKFYYFSEIKVA